MLRHPMNIAGQSLLLRVQMQGDQQVRPYEFPQPQHYISFGIVEQTTKELPLSRYPFP